MKPDKSSTDPLSFRPINLLSHLSKIIEKVWQNQILDYLKYNKLIPQQHHGGIKGRSTNTATLEIIEKIATMIQDRLEGALISLDQSSAFDLIDHDILIEKLRIYGVDEDFCTWITSYLTN